MMLARIPLRVRRYNTPRHQFGRLGPTAPSAGQFRTEKRRSMVLGTTQRSLRAPNSLRRQPRYNLMVSEVPEWTVYDTYKWRLAGSAIYVYGILAATTPGGLTGFTDLTFFLDGETVGGLVMSTAGQQGFKYNFSVYSNTSIPHGTHNFTMQNGGTAGGGNSLVLLDYIVYS